MKAILLTAILITALSLGACTTSTTTDTSGNKTTTTNVSNDAATQAAIAEAIKLADAAAIAAIQVYMTNPQGQKLTASRPSLNTPSIHQAYLATVRKVQGDPGLTILTAAEARNAVRRAFQKHLN